MDDELLKKIRDLAKEYDIKIIMPKKSHTEKLLSINNLISISQNSSMNVTPLKMSMNKFRTPLIFYIKNDMENEFLMELEKENNRINESITSIPDVIKYENFMKLLHNCALNNKEKYVKYVENFIENNITIKKIEDKKDIIFLNYLKQDNVNSLISKYKVENVINKNNIIDRLFISDSINIFDFLWSIDKFKKLVLERSIEFFIPLDVNYRSDKMLDLILKDTDIKNLDVNRSYTKFSNAMQSVSFNIIMNCFNRFITSILKNTDYQFNDEDLYLFNDENKELLGKKNLYTLLDNDLNFKNKEKRKKI